MHKCPKCQTEFNGKFCPECGHEWAEAKFCPMCGARISGPARFCEECGYSFVDEINIVSNNSVNESVSSERLETKQISEQQTPKVRPQNNNAEDRPSMLFSIVKYVPILLLMTFSILMLIFFSVNIAVMPATTVMGIAVSAQPYGSIYGDILENLPEIKGVIIALIVFTSLAIVYTLLCIIITRLHKTKYYRMLFLGNYDIFLSEMFSILSPIIYALFIILSSVLMGKLSSLDGGSGLVEIAAYPKLVLAFSIIFFVVSFTMSILRIVKYKAFYVQGGIMSAERKAELVKFYATHTPPIAPKEMTTSTSNTGNGVPANGYKSLAAKRLEVAYKYDKHRYDNGKEGKTPAAVIWFDLNKGGIIALAVIIAITVILLATLIPYCTNIFRVGKVEDIKFGMSQESVLDILGEPYDKKDLSASSSSDILSGGGSGIIDSVAGSGADDNIAVVRWRYYSKDYAKARKEVEMQLEALGLKGGLDAVISGGLGGITGVASSMASALTPLLSKVYNYIQVDFDDNGRVVKVILEKSRCDAISNKARKVSRYSISDSTLYFYEDYTGLQNSATIVTKSQKASYTAYFDGGSFIRSYIDDFQFKDFGDADKESVNVTWKDNYAQYSTTQAANKLGHVASGGEWVNNYSLDNVDYLPNTIKAIGNNTFKDSDIYSIIIPNSVTTIGNNAFSACDNLSKVTIGNMVASIGEYAFSNCKKLRSIDIPDSVKTIGKGAFKDCESTSDDTKLTICCAGENQPNGWDENWNESGYNVFWRCTTKDGIKYSLRYGSRNSEAVVIIQDKDIETITIPSIVYGNVIGMTYKVVEIAERAFHNCSNLTSVTIPNSVTSIGSNAFWGCSGLTSITVDSNNPNYSSQDGILYNKLKTEILFVSKAIVAVTIPNSVTSIGYMAFGYCSSLTSIAISNNVMSIGDYAFRGCSSLTSIEISNSVTSIGSYVFYDCCKLTSITIPNSVTSIERGAFLGCSGLTSIMIPNSVTSIGYSAFGDCSGLSEITIPNSVTSIGDWAFSGCSSLTSIRFNGTKAQWKAIRKGYSWYCDTDNYTVICTDGTLSKSES